MPYLYLTLAHYMDPQLYSITLKMISKSIVQIASFLLISRTIMALESLPIDEDVGYAHNCPKNMRIECRDQVFEAMRRGDDYDSIDVSQDCCYNLFVNYDLVCFYDSFVKDFEKENTCAKDKNRIEDRAGQVRFFCQKKID